MKKRLLAAEVVRAARQFPVVVLTGPRQSGKTTLLEMLPFRTDYRLLEDPDELERVKSDPRGWIASCRPPAIVDEIQHAPELFAYIRSEVDRKGGRGRWFLTGSQDFGLMKGVSESMAGRAAILRLLPFSLAEIYGARLPKWPDTAKRFITGFYPPPALGKTDPDLWYSSYLQTYIEKDVRQAVQVEDVTVFRRFLRGCAARVGQVLNMSDMAAPLGVSVPTIRRWLSVLELTQQIVLVQPYFSNLGKRLIKSPKLYFGDVGLLCHLLNLESSARALNSPFAGFLFENLLLTEILKLQAHRGRRPEIYFFRDQSGLEVDFLFPWNGRTWLVEAKLTSTPRPMMAQTMISLMPKLGRTPAVQACLVTSQGPEATVAPAVSTRPVALFLRELANEKAPRLSL